MLHETGLPCKSRLCSTCSARAGFAVPVCPTLKHPFSCTCPQSHMLRGHGAASEKESAEDAAAEAIKAKVSFAVSRAQQRTQWHTCLCALKLWDFSSAVDRS
eukprot:1140394-Pelagomonas_calceolata.AAC.1